MSEAGAIYVGKVVHARKRPRAHRLSYRVVSLLVDVDRLEDLSRGTRLFSYNGFAPFVLRDRDYGDGGRSIADHARNVLYLAGHETAGLRIELLTYPRVFGYAFNPLSVYFCHREGDGLRSIIYEVSNTFGERKSYVCHAGREHPDHSYHQASKKELSVSPFTHGQGRYGFSVRPPGPDVVVGVHLRDDHGAILRTHFRGAKRALTDRELCTVLASNPLGPRKVISAIHWEALRLYLKGVPLVPRHRSPPFSLAGSSDSPSIGVLNAQERASDAK